MSRVGKKPIPIPDGVELKIDGSTLSVKGPRGELSRTFDPDMRLVVEEGVLEVHRPTEQGRHRALHGLTRSLAANMVEGVTNGFERSLEIHGVGYRVESRGGGLIFRVGFSHTVEVAAPDGIELVVESPTLVHVRGIDKQVVGEQAARIRRLRPPDAYKGKGVRYRGEKLRLKPGKSAARSGI